MRLIVTVHTHTPRLHIKVCWLCISQLHVVNWYMYEDACTKSHVNLLHIFIFVNALIYVVYSTRNRFHLHFVSLVSQGPSYGSWIYNSLCNRCLSPLILWVRISIRARCTTLYDKVCQWLATGRWFSPGHPVSSTNKTDRNDITEILLKWR
jgi:hypothetical protein